MLAWFYYLDDISNIKSSSPPLSMLTDLNFISYSRADISVNILIILSSTVKYCGINLKYLFLSAQLVGIVIVLHVRYLALISVMTGAGYRLI